MTLQMLPFGGQGANSAIEDAGSLGYLLTNIDDAELITKQFTLFERARKARASRVQILSSVRAGKEKEVEKELRRYADPPGSSELQPSFSSCRRAWCIIDYEADVPTSMIERTIHDYR